MAHTARKSIQIRGRREEDYLRVLYELKKEKGVIRVKDVALKLGVRPASVVDYLERLRSRGLVIYRKRGLLDLTREGSDRARRLYERHHAIKEFLSVLLGISEEQAEDAACLMEHGLSDDLLRRIELFMEFVHTCQEGLPRFLNHLYFYYSTGKRPPECIEECMSLRRRKNDGVEK